MGPAVDTEHRNEETDDSALFDRDFDADEEAEPGALELADLGGGNQSKMRVDELFGSNEPDVSAR